jgi:UDP-N-acetylglucosamine 1-carboxyvinyltransferase
MEKLLVKGGARPKGFVKISGAKNAALPIIAASLLTRERVTLHNIPMIGDVNTMIGLLRDIGANISLKNNNVEIVADDIKTESLSHHILTSKIRYSTHLIGALLPRFKKIVIFQPGGCEIGSRNLNSHFLGLTQLGAQINLKGSHIEAKTDKLRGHRIKLEFPSVGATENVIIAASLANGSSIIENAAKEPEIADLTNFLNSMGADISGGGTETIKVKGVGELNGTEYTIMPDRIETGTYLIITIIAKGDVLIQNTNLHFLESVVSTLVKIGAKISVTNEGVRATANENLRPIDIITEVYPGFPTDMQPIITPLLTAVKGQSTIKETIFDNRFHHVQELWKMGANIKIMGNTIYIKGKEKLLGAQVNAHDIRSGASLIIAGLVAEGNTIIENAHQILRGYEKPLEKLQALGVECFMSQQ